MKLISYLNADREERVGLFCDGKIVDFASAGDVLGRELPSTMTVFLENAFANLKIADQIQTAFTEKKVHAVPNADDVKIIAPVPHPPTCRDAYAFRQHVATARKNRGVEMIPEFDQFPIFYFTNHHSMVGPGELMVEDDHLQKLDFELEVAAVIGKRGKNIESRDADQYILGLTIMNDFTARQFAMEEMLLNLGPAKGKDFATALGPWLVTMDELEPFRIKTEFGDKYDLEMKALHNGKLVSHGNMKDMNWTFAEIIERASYGVELYPGDVIGSGTVGTGCYFELNGTGGREAKEKGVPFTPVWLKEGDTIELEVTGLGKLTHTIARSKERRSILAKKKML